LALLRSPHSVGLLDRTEAAALRRTAQETGQRPIDVLLQRIDDKRLAEQLHEHLGLPLVDLPGASIDPAVLRLLSKELAKRYDAMPIRMERGRVVIAFANTLDTEGVKAVEFSTRSKVMATLDITERRRPQDGGIRVTFEDRKADVRVSVLPTQFGEKVVLRLLDPTSKGHELEKMGLAAPALELLRREIRRPEGMILISGPTGSGESTTAHGLLQDIADSRLNIVTIENTIEHRLAGISQVEVNEKAGLSFADTLCSILRQDPDVIFVGEIRDAETASIALRAAQTGHLVVSTVHTIDASASITRLLDLGIDPSLISASLRLVIAQRLVRSLCRYCKRPPTPPSEIDLARLARHGLAVETVTTAPGCNRCRDTGFCPRVGVFEILPVSRQMRAMLERHEPETVLRSRPGPRASSRCPRRRSARSTRASRRWTRCSASYRPRSLRAKIRQRTRPTRPRCRMSRPSARRNPPRYARRHCACWWTTTRSSARGSASHSRRPRSPSKPSSPPTERGPADL